LLPLRACTGAESPAPGPRTPMFSVADTIVAIATPPGRGGIGVVRLSGPDALAIAQRLTTHDGAFEPRRATFTNVRLNADTGRSEDRPLQVSDRDRPESAAQESITVRKESATVRQESVTVRQESGPGRPTPLDETIDHAVVTYFPAPASYNGDDVMELSAHGSPVVLRGIVTAAIARGARLAEPGEFTLRGISQRPDRFDAGRGRRGSHRRRDAAAGACGVRSTRRHADARDSPRSTRRCSI